MTKQTSWESVVLDKRVEECAEFFFGVIRALKGVRLTREESLALVSMPSKALFSKRVRKYRRGWIEVVNLNTSKVLFSRLARKYLPPALLRTYRANAQLRCEFDLEILQHLTPGVAKKAALAKLTQETLKQLTDRKNMVRFNYADIITMLSMGTKVSQKLEGKPKAALLLITVPKTKGLAEVDKIGERLTEKLPEETDVCWAARTSPNASRTSVTAYYVY